MEGNRVRKEGKLGGKGRKSEGRVEEKGKLNKGGKRRG